MNSITKKLAAVLLVAGVAFTSVSITDTSVASAGELTEYQTDKDGRTYVTTQVPDPAAVYHAARKAAKEYLDQGTDTSDPEAVIGWAARQLTDAGLTAAELANPATREVALAKAVLWAAKLLNYGGEDAFFDPSDRELIGNLLSGVEALWTFSELYLKFGTGALALAELPLLATISLSVYVGFRTYEVTDWALQRWAPSWRTGAGEWLGGVAPWPFATDVENNFTGLSGNLLQTRDPNAGQTQSCCATPPRPEPTTTAPPDPEPGDRPPPGERPEPPPDPGGDGGTTPPPADTNSTDPDESDGTFVEREPSSALDVTGAVLSRTLNPDRKSYTVTYYNRQNGKITKVWTEQVPVENQQQQNQKQQPRRDENDAADDDTADDTPSEAPDGQDGPGTKRADPMMPSEPGPPVSVEFLLRVVFPEFGRALQEMAPSLADPGRTDPCGPNAMADPESGCGTGNGGSVDSIRTWSGPKPDCDDPEGCGIGYVSGAQIAAILRSDPQDLCNSYTARTGSDDDCAQQQGTGTAPPPKSPFGS